MAQDPKRRRQPWAASRSGKTARPDRVSYGHSAGTVAGAAGISRSGGQARRAETKSEQAGVARIRRVAEIRSVERRLCRNRPPLRVADYIGAPRASGYRAVDVVVSYPDEHGVARAIEVQLRTRIMHEWAVTVERLGGRIEADLKSGVGPRPVLDFLRTASAAMAIEEAGGMVARELAAEVVTLRAAAMPYLERNSGRNKP